MSQEHTSGLDSVAEEAFDTLQRENAQLKEVMAAQADGLKRHIADLENALSDIKQHRDEALAALLTCHTGKCTDPRDGVDGLGAQSFDIEKVEAAIASLKGGA